jgi:choline dehydrogenase-like flavoprotein
MALLEKDALADLSAYDVIIAGSGFAALPIAETLSASYRVLILEGGGQEESPEHATLAAVDDYGHYTNGHWAAHAYRGFGGTSARWAGWCLPLAAEEFQPSTNKPGWPMPPEALTPYYSLAAKYVGIDPGAFYPSTAIQENAGLRWRLSVNSNARRLAGKLSKFNKHPSIDVILNTHLIRPLSTSRRIVDGLEVSHADGHISQLSVKENQQVVIACGGMGNAQILLQPQPGSDTPIGNESGLVGKFLMEHPHAYCADIVVNTELQPTAPPNIGSYLWSYWHNDEAANSAAGACLLDFHPPRNDAVREKFKTLLPSGSEHARHYRIGARAEMAPDAANHVTLQGERNWAGLYRCRAHCSLSTVDFHTIEGSARALGEWLVKTGKGIARINNDEIYRNVRGGGHTMGTTRMGANPAQSVCDDQLRIHGYQNLYVSGSSVFPRAGAANPTLTITALAYRLADTLEERLKEA